MSHEVLTIIYNRTYIPHFEQHSIGNHWELYAIRAFYISAILTMKTPISCFSEHGEYMRCTSVIQCCQYHIVSQFFMVLIHAVRSTLMGYTIGRTSRVVVVAIMSCDARCVCTAVSGRATLARTRTKTAP